MSIYKGVKVSNGISIGKVLIYKPYKPIISSEKIEKNNIENEILSFKNAKNKASLELDELINNLKKDKSDIFVAHKMMILDPDMGDEIIEKIQDSFNAKDAVDTVIKDYIAMLKKSNSELMRERIFDLIDVENRLLRCLDNIPQSDLSSITEPVILVSHDLCPSDTATLNKEMIQGIITEIGGVTSHSAIIARSYEIPAVLGVNNITSILKDNDEIILDAINSEIITNPTEEEKEVYKTKRKEFLAFMEEVKTYINRVPITKDGERINVNLNVASVKLEDLYCAKDADGCGLFRTEFIFMGRDTLPTEDEQFEIYKKVLLTFKGRVTIRTLDIGGDKKLDSMELPKEDNPFLGLRALRLCLVHKDIFKTQLRAIIRASIYGKLNVMFPMVGTIEDINNALDVVKEVKAELDKEQIKYSDDIKWGIMIEIPSIAILSDQAAKLVDFASIGTNDLCQYTLAVDRMNPNVSSYYQMFNPSVFRLIRYVVKEFNKEGKVAAVCGEMGGNPLSAAVLIGFGMRNLSMSGSNIARVKKMIVSSNLIDLERISETVVNLPTQKDIIDYLQKEVK